MDQIRQQALAIAVERSHQLERELRQHKRASIALIMLVKARRECAEALEALAFFDLEKREEARALQNEVRRFDDLVRWCREIIAEGEQAEADLEREDQEEIQDLVNNEEDDS